MAEPGKILDVRGIWHSVFDQDNAVLKVSSTAVTATLGASDGTDIGDVDVASIAAGENHVGQVGGETIVVDLQGTNDTDAYADGDVLWNTLEVTGALRSGGPFTGVIQSVTVIDYDDQGGTIDLVFFSGNSSLGTTNSAVSMTDNTNVLGVVNIATWDDLINSQVAMETNVGLVVQSTSTSIWCGAVTRAAVTYTSTKANYVRIGILQD